MRLERINGIHESDHKAGAKPPTFWRVISGVTSFLDACRSYRYETRIHQYVRAIESFLPPSAFGQRLFAKKAALLCEQGERTTDALKEMYRLRNKAEHHEYFEEAKLSGGIPEDVARLRALQAEALCIELYRRFFTKSVRFLDLYRDSETIEGFWSTDSGVQSEWGSPFGFPEL